MQLVFCLFLLFFPLIEKDLSLKKYFMLVFCLLCQPTLAAGYLTPNGTGVTINKMTMHANGGVTLWVSGVTNADNCGDSTLVHLKGDLPGHNHMVSAAMAAYLSGKKVGLWSTGCDIIPFWGGTTTRPIIHTLWITE
jgi:hypothetical protein